jgi:hypothetical protein
LIVIAKQLSAGLRCAFSTIRQYGNWFAKPVNYLSLHIDVTTLSPMADEALVLEASTVRRLGEA